MESYLADALSKADPYTLLQDFLTLEEVHKAWTDAVDFDRKSK